MAKPNDAAVAALLQTIDGRVDARARPIAVAVSRAYLAAFVTKLIEAGVLPVGTTIDFPGDIDEECAAV